MEFVVFCMLGASTFAAGAITGWVLHRWAYDLDQQDEQP